MKSKNYNGNRSINIVNRLHGPQTEYEHYKPQAKQVTS